MQSLMLGMRKKKEVKNKEEKGNSHFCSLTLWALIKTTLGLCVCVLWVIHIALSCPLRCALMHSSGCCEGGEWPDPE